MSYLCSIVPPHLLQGIADSDENTEEVRNEARTTLEHHHRLAATRKERLAHSHGSRIRSSYHSHPFIPQHVLQRIAESQALDEETPDGGMEEHALLAEVSEPVSQDAAKLQPETAQQPATVQQPAKTQQPAATQQPASTQQSATAQESATTQDSATTQQPAQKPKERASCLVYHAHNTTMHAGLPGILLRSDGGNEVDDKAVNEAFDNVETVLQFYRDVFKWNSMDDKNMDVVSSVHFAHRLQNAFWDGDQMLFGDGGKYIYNFTACLDVIGHELTHAVTQHTTALAYESESGALNEHLSDVFGIMIKQKAENTTADKADWLIGEGCLLPGVTGTALRSMKAPGTAYNDVHFGKDLQVSHMKDFQTAPIDAAHDYGQVHTNSGIPNKAFYLAALALGGYSWEKAGPIWWKAVTSGRVPPKSTFLQFADVTVECAKDVGGEDAASIVRQAWADVGVQRSAV